MNIKALMLIVGICTITIILLFLLIPKKQQDSKLEHWLQRVKAAGVITDFADLPSVVGSGGRDATKEWGIISKSSEDFFRKQSSVSEKLDDETAFRSLRRGDAPTPVALQVIHNLAPLYQQYETAVLGDYIALPDYFKNPNAGSIVHADRFRDAMRLFSIRAGVSAFQGDVRACLDDLMRIQKVCKIAKTFPDIMTYAFISTEIATLFRQMPTILNSLKQNPVALSELLEILQSIPIATFKEKLGIVLAFIRVDLQLIRQKDPTAMKPTDDHSDFNKIIELIQDNTDLVELILVEFVARVAESQPSKEVYEKLEDELIEGTGWAKQYPLRGRLPAGYIGLMPSMTFTATQKSDAYKQVILIASAAVLILAESGKLPDLDTAAKRARISAQDTHGNKPLIYQFDSKTLRVRSVSENLKDDGGERKKPADDWASIAVELAKK